MRIDDTLLLDVLLCVLLRVFDDCFIGRKCTSTKFTENANQLMRDLLLFAAALASEGELTAKKPIDARR